MGRKLGCGCHAGHGGRARRKPAHQQPRARRSQLELGWQRFGCTRHQLCRARPGATRVSSGPKAGTKSPDTAADTLATAGAARPGLARAHRRKRSESGVGIRGYRDEFLDATATVDAATDVPAPANAAGSQGAGTSGFAGTAPTTSGAAAGMVQLSSHSTSTTVPLLPTTWTTDAEQ